MSLDTNSHNDKSKVESSETSKDIKFLQNNNICPTCKSTALMKEGRCTTCIDCGWSKCDI